MVNDLSCLSKQYIPSRGDPGIVELLGLKICFIIIVPLKYWNLGCFRETVSVISVSDTLLSSYSQKPLETSLSGAAITAERAETSMWASCVTSTLTVHKGTMRENIAVSISAVHLEDRGAGGWQQVFNEAIGCLFNI